MLSSVHTKVACFRFMVWKRITGVLLVDLFFQLEDSGPILIELPVLIFWICLRFLICFFLNTSSSPQAEGVLQSSSHIVILIYM